METALADRFRRVALLAAPTLVGVLLCVSAPAQQSSAQPMPSPSSGRAMPTPDQLEPGVNTTAPAPASTPPDAAAGSAPAARESAAPARAAAEPRATTQPQPNAASPSTVSAPGPAGSPKEPATAKNAARKGGPDRIELDTTDITGNRELPKVLYIVPWKHSDLGDLVGKPVNSLLDEVLQPLDRDVFQRENRYYDGLKPGPDGAKAGAVQGSDNKP